MAYDKLTHVLIGLGMVYMAFPKWEDCQKQELGNVSYPIIG